MKFKRTKVSSLSGNSVEVHFTEDKPLYETDPFTIVASYKSVTFKGRSGNFAKTEDLKELAKTIQLARAEADKIKPHFIGVVQ